jgi:hypothetical protein
VIAEEITNAADTESAPEEASVIVELSTGAALVMVY